MATKKQIRDFLKEGEKEGFSPKELEKILEKKGFSDSFIKEAEHPIISKLKSPVVITVLSLLLIAIITFSIFSLMPSTCDKACFIDKANNCEKATLDIDISGSTLRLISNDCTLTKEFTSFSDEEPD